MKNSDLINILFKRMFELGTCMNADDDGAVAKRGTHRAELVASASEQYSAIVVRSFMWSLWSRRMNLPIDLKCNSPYPNLCY